MLQIVLTVLIASQLVIGFLIYLQSLRTKRTDQRLFAVIALVISLWTITNSLLLQVNNPGSAHDTYLPVINRFAFVLASLALVCIYSFGFYYPRRKPLSKITPKVILAIGLLCAASSLFDPIAGTFAIRHGEYIYRYGTLVPLIGVYALVVLGSLFINQWAVLVHAERSSRIRKQSATLVAGISLTVIHAIIFIVILPGIFGQSSILYGIGYMAPFYIIICVAYGLARFGLFEVRVFVARALTYFLSSSIVSVLYVVSAVLLTTYVLHTQLRLGTLIYLAFITLVVSLLFQPLRSYFNRATSHLFYRDMYVPQEFFDQINQILVSTIEVEKMLSGVLGCIDKNIKPESSFVVLLAKDARPRIISNDNRDEQQSAADLLHILRGFDKLLPLVVITEELDDQYASLRHAFDKADIAVIAELGTKPAQGLGYLVLGPRKNGTSYNNQDRQVINTLANELIIAIQNTLRFEEIQKFNVTLQQKVDEATRKLRNTNDKLRTLDQTKDDFISMASHQLRTPLTSVKGYISMVLDGDAGTITPMQRKLLDQSFISSQRMVYLIADLLNISRLKTGKFIIESSPTNLAQITKDEVSQLVETAKGRGLELTYDKPTDFPTYMLDTVKIRQVIMNFVDNAIYYTPSGGHVHVELRDTPRTIELRVIDDGIGVPKSLQHHLFSKFYRAPNAQKVRPDGTGLGLFMAKKVIIAQGGALIYESTEGKGSTFGFSFAKSHLALASTKTSKYI